MPGKPGESSLALPDEASIHAGCPVLSGVRGPRYHGSGSADFDASHLPASPTTLFYCRSSLSPLDGYAPQSSTEGWQAAIGALYSLHMSLPSLCTS